MERLCRQTQTVDTQQRSAQTRREAAVQMARPDVLLDDSLDRVVAPSELCCTHLNPAGAHSALSARMEVQPGMEVIYLGAP